MPKEFRSNYTQHLASTLENSLKANPELFSGDFEFLLMNKDTLHESYLYEQMEIYWDLHDIQFSEEIANHYVNLVEQAPIFMMSIDTSSTLEKNKFLIPDNYQLNDVEWCERYMKNTVTGFDLYPWEQRIEKAFFRGRATGANMDYFPGL